MFKVAAMTIDTGQAGSQMDIFVRLPSFGGFCADDFIGMAEITSVVCDFSFDVKEDFVLTVKCVFTICNGNRTGC